MGCEISDKVRSEVCKYSSYGRCGSGVKRIKVVFRVEGEVVSNVISFLTFSVLCVG
jgi:hypothetical protein